MTRWREWSSDLDEAVLAAKYVAEVKDILCDVLVIAQKQLVVGSARSERSSWNLCLLAFHDLGTFAIYFQWRYPDGEDIV